jgi:hypothetical protein
MPWTPKDASGKTKKASTPTAKKQWAGTANAVLKKTGNEASAVKIANAAVSKNKVFGMTVKPKEKPFGAFGGAKNSRRLLPSRRKRQNAVAVHRAPRTSRRWDLRLR